METDHHSYNPTGNQIFMLEIKNGNEFHVRDRKQVQLSPTTHARALI